MNHLDLTEREYQQFRALVHEKCGINLGDSKKELVRARLSKRLRQTGHKGYEEYLKFLISDISGEEIIRMLNAISTNLTSFFRESKHFDFLKQNYLPGFIKGENGTRKNLKVWSAGCSSGEEPYSLAMCLSEFFGDGVGRFNILATDLSTEVLSKAKSGVYETGRTRSIPTGVLHKYFQKGTGKKNGYVRTKNNIRSLIDFRRLNLMDDFPFRNEFDIIFCRNVMIYFDKKVQEDLVSKYYNSLKSGGYLFIGHSESLMGINHKFVYIKPTIYLKK